MNILKCLFVGVCLAGALPAPSWAQVYRCVGPNGTVSYADEPCAKSERGGQVDIQPLVIDSKEGRARSQKALDELKQRPSDVPPNTAEPSSRGDAAPAPGRDRVNRLERCQPLLEQASGVRRQAIGALCGADLDEASFDSCLASVQAADGTGEMEAHVRACTGSGFGGTTVIQRPVVRPGGHGQPSFCAVYPNDPTCRKPMKPAPEPDRMGPRPNGAAVDPAKPVQPRQWGGAPQKPPVPEDTDRR